MEKNMEKERNIYDRGELIFEGEFINGRKKSK